jgi:hypothetical protein
MLFTCSRGACTALLAALVIHSNVAASAQQPLADETLPEKLTRPAHFLVLRLSGAMLNSLIDKPIDVQMPVRDVVLGTPVTGVARVTGRPQVVLEPSYDQAKFKMTVSGTVYSRTVGARGPATIYGRSITTFTASAPIIFEPGKGFHALPLEIATHTRVYTDNITTSRGGPIGKIVRRRAWEQVSAQRAELTAIARQRATARVAAAFTKHLDERVARLNRAIEFRATIANLRNQVEGTPQVVCCTTPLYVEIADTLGAERATIVLPVLASASDAAAPIELWIHNRILPEGLANALKTLLSSPDQNAIVNALALMPGTFGKEAAAAVTAFITENQIGIQSLGDWTVIEVNTRPDKNVTLARSINR